MPKARDLFVDTSGWGYHLVNTEPLHTRVEILLSEAATHRRKLITTNYIIHELVALLTLNRFHLSRPKVIEAINKIKRDVSVEVVQIERAIDDKAWALLEAHPNQEWSLVDASSIIVMKDFGMTEALSTDSCFPQQGLIKLLDARLTS